MAGRSGIKTWVRYHVFVSCVIEGMKKRGEFKISLSNPRDGKILLNSTASCRESMSGRGAGKGML